MFYTKIDRKARYRFNSIGSGLLLGFFTMLFSAVSADAPVQFSDAWMDQSFDWVLKIDPALLPNYAIYDGSSLKPVIDLKTSIRLNPGLMKGQTQQFALYEDLWYGNGTAIGCRQSMPLPLQSGLRGTIYIPLSDLAAMHPDAFAHAITRLTVDVSLRNCNVISVVLPESAINPIADSMRKYGFARTRIIPEESNQDSLMLLLTPGTDSEVTTMLERRP